MSGEKESDQSFLFRLKMEWAFGTCDLVEDIIQATKRVFMKRDGHFDWPKTEGGSKYDPDVSVILKIGWHRMVSGKKKRLA